MTFFFSWPVVALALICSALGLIYRMPLPLVAAAVLVAPLSLYFGASPYFRWCLGLPLIPLLAAFAVTKGHRKLAIALIALLFGVFAWILVLVDRARRETDSIPHVGASYMELNGPSIAVAQMAVSLPGSAAGRGCYGVLQSPHGVGPGFRDESA